MSGRPMTDDLYREKLKSRCVVTEKGCWEYQGYCGWGDYGQMGYRGKTWPTHRLSFTLFKGPIPEGMDVCHSCDNPPCCNPDHLWPGDPKANSRDCVEKGRHHKAQNTHCPRGHAFAEHGRQYNTGQTWRACLACERGRQRMASGWPEDLAYSLPVIPHGQRPVNINQRRKPTGVPIKRTHCKRGHEMTPENSYPKPGGKRQCRICHDVAERAGVERRRAARNKEHANNG